MAMTAQSVKTDSMKDVFNISKSDFQHVIALAGNPNTGKSTVFNYLTGLKQHTGNWPGKTVVSARGEFTHNDAEYVLVDLPGSYSLFAASKDEEVSRDFICYGDYDAVVVVADATCLERNLNLVFQISEITNKLILCINLIDEAKKKNITIDKEGLEKELNIPIVLTSARSGVGMDELKNTIEKVSYNRLEYSPNLLKYDDKTEEKISELIPHLRKLNISNERWTALRLLDSSPDIFSYKKENHLSKESALSIIESTGIESCNTNIREKISEMNYNYANKLKMRYVKEDTKKINRDKKIDDIITSKIFGIPIMLTLLGLIFWITIQGANIPSQFLSNLLFGLKPHLSELLVNAGTNEYIIGALVDGVYSTLAWVVSVMLPPMAIFFPLFSLFEDLGYLPRVAFNLDHLFKKACAHGKQCLTMCMGFGCNAAGVIGCRIIDSPRERLIAVITNNFVPCNGRFPTIIAIASAFFAITSSSLVNGLVPSIFITLMVLIGICVTLLVSYLLSKTLLKGIPSTFTLELPPYRVPQIGRLLYTSIIDRTIFVLSRAIIVAAPAGLVTWMLANIYVGDISILAHVAEFLDPVGKIIGLDGFILMAFIVGLPANEIVLPVLLMAYLSTGTLTEFESIGQLRNLLLDNGWTVLTALNVMLFSLLHWPCSTTLWTIKKETGSIKWTVAAFIIPTAIAFAVCFVTASIYKIIF
ncbi:MULTISPECIES: ferrous iron transport protein B [unclassified Sedimentibacter]|uniref:ferrous iron transport protein B n=1 Tax=unclassified Sedimentibacter TaxID=2649220 RepID=UPI0027E00721|nr:ferrous iron transport protein B [Sedimentibacter sp. MB35-C1]WMJ78393.1 ferrous iron transport protein B [Sedimentibacter sp. MB35-C1]